MYFFTILSICVINSTFIVIIEDGYVRSKYFNRNAWLDEDLEPEGPTHDPIMFTVPGQQMAAETKPEVDPDDVNNPFGNLNIES